MRVCTKYLAAFAAFSLLSGVIVFADSTTRPAVPQAKPFVDFLAAVTAGDADKFRDVQSKSVRESKQPWTEKLQEAKSSLNRRYGEYDMSKFVFSYSGGDSQGDLTITYQDQHPTTMKVVKEGDGWKLASH